MLIVKLINTIIKRDTDTYLYLSILNHRPICPFSAHFSIFFHVGFMGRHIKFMLNFPFHAQLPWKNSNEYYKNIFLDTFKSASSGAQRSYFYFLSR